MVAFLRGTRLQHVGLLRLYDCKRVPITHYRSEIAVD